MAKRSKESYTIQAVLHALDLLEQFDDEFGEIGVTDLARRLGLHKNNVFRLLATLETRGYVVQNLDTEGYSLGVKALKLGRNYLKHMDIIEISEPVIAELRDHLLETAYLAILQREEVVFVLAEESPQTVRVASQAGVHLPAFTTTSGKVQLAYLDPLPYLTHPLRRVSDPTPADVRKLERELKKVREMGYCLDAGGFDRDVTSVSAPVFNDRGKIAGAITVSAPSFRLAKERDIKELTEQVIAAANKVSHALGHGVQIK